MRKLIRQKVNGGKMIVVITMILICVLMGAFGQVFM